MKRGHLSAKEKEEIRALTLSGVRQSEISRRLRIGRDTVSAWQVRMGLNTHLVIPEDEIMRLFKLGWGGYRIHRHLKIPVNQVYAVAHKNNFRRTDNIGYPEPWGDIPGFIEALKRREGYIEHLGKKFGLGYCQAQKIAHEVLQTIQFAPGPSKPPLSSNFPQKHYERERA